MITLGLLEKVTLLEYFPASLKYFRYILPPVLFGGLQTYVCNNDVTLRTKYLVFLYTLKPSD